MRKILVVEDDPSVASLVRTLLEAEGYFIQPSADIEGAWAQLMEDWQAPDAVVVDLRLRGQDGWKLIERLRNDDRFRTLPIVVLSGLPESEVSGRATALGAQYLSKPFSAAGLLDRLQLAMKEAGITGALRAVGVALLLDTFRVEGHVHLAGEVQRFSDAWEAVMRDARAYIPVTNARVVTLDGNVVAQAPYLSVRKSDVRAVIPAQPRPAAE